MLSRSGHNRRCLWEHSNANWCCCCGTVLFAGRTAVYSVFLLSSSGTGRTSRQFAFVVRENSPLQTRRFTSQQGRLQSDKTRNRTRGVCRAHNRDRSPLHQPLLLLCSCACSANKTVLLHLLRNREFRPSSKILRKSDPAVKTENSDPVEYFRKSQL